MTGEERWKFRMGTWGGDKHQRREIIAVASAVRTPLPCFYVIVQVVFGRPNQCGHAAAGMRKG